MNWAERNLEKEAAYIVADLYKRVRRKMELEGRCCAACGTRHPLATVFTRIEGFGTVCGDCLPVTNWRVG